MKNLLNVWSRRAPEEEPRPPKISDHILSVSPTVDVTQDRLPADVLLSSPGIRYLTVLTLEPDEATDYARRYAMKYALKLAEELDGLLEDPNPEPGQDRLIPKCAGFVYPPINEYTKMLRLSVYFEPDAAIFPISVGLPDLFRRLLPQALPIKYGVSEPPEQVFDGSDDAIAHLTDFLSCQARLVWYSTYPVTHVFLRDAYTENAASPASEYRASCITLEMPDALYDMPEWSFALRRLLKELTLHTHAFFGQIVRGGGGIASWWWRGIPMQLGVACTIGGAYYPLIPDCTAKGEHIADGVANGVAYFEEPNGPFIPSDLISAPKKRFFGRARTYTYKEDFTVAKTIPLTGASHDDR